MSAPNPDFAHFKFVRNAAGQVVSLPSQTMSEKNFLAIDYERWGLARLHIFEGVASREDMLESFLEELEVISGIRSASLSRLVAWGRDSDELFYADCMLDGEPLPDYLQRNGRVAIPVAAEWLLQIMDLMELVPAGLPSFARYSTVNFQVVINQIGQIQPVFCEFLGWSKPGMQERDQAPEWYLAQIFCSIMGGVPIRNFSSESLPRYFDELDSDAADCVLQALREGEPGAYEAFRETMTRLAEGADAVRDSVIPPLMPAREWLREDLSASYPGKPDFSLSESFELHEGLYAIKSTIRGKPSYLQVLPGPGLIPRNGWLSQHHDSTRRPGRPVPNQVHLNYIEDRDNVTLIGEEAIMGVDLLSLILSRGPLPEAEMALVMSRVENAISTLEERIGAFAIWWLPPENVFFLTGTPSTDASWRLIDRRGSEAWESLAVKLRLHQTTRTLRDGVALPPKVRELSLVPGRNYEALRRSVIALPLIFFLLTGRHLRWRQPISEQVSLSDGLSEMLERYRVQILEAEKMPETDLLVALKSVDARSGSEESEAVDPSPDDRFEQMLGERLYEGTVALGEGNEATVDEPSSLEETVESSPPEEVLLSEDDFESVGTISDLDPPEGVSPHEAETLSPLEPEPKRAFWTLGRNLWVALAGVLVALLVGYLLAGWSAKVGPVPVDTTVEFPRSDYEATEEETRDAVLLDLQEYFVVEARPALLSAVKALDEGENRRLVVTALQEMVAEEKVDAALLTARLAMVDGAPASDIAAMLETTARLGDPTALFMIAERRLVINPSAEDREEALELLARAASMGHRRAQELLAVLKVDEGELDRAFELMTSAAEKDQVSAIYQLGLMIANGIGVPRDAAEAFARFEQAAERSNRNAMFALGKCYEIGFGVEMDAALAARWMKNAASLGSEAAIEWCQAREISIPLLDEEP